MTEPRDLEDQPFPLRRHFRRRILPLLAAFIAVLVGLTAFAARHAMEAIYLDLAQRRAEAGARAVSAAAPEAWRSLLSGRLAGDAARELSDAIIVNPYDGEEFAEAIHRGLTMDPDERSRRMRSEAG